MTRSSLAAVAACAVLSVGLAEPARAADALAQGALEIRGNRLTIYSDADLAPLLAAARLPGGTLAFSGSHLLRVRCPR